MARYSQIIGSPFGRQPKPKALLAQPFKAARQPDTWRSAVMRAVRADLFALMGVESPPQARRGEVARLNELAIEHAFTVLRGPLPERNPLRVIRPIGFASGLSNKALLPAVFEF